MLRNLVKALLLTAAILSVMLSGLPPSLDKAHAFVTAADRLATASGHVGGAYIGPCDLVTCYEFYGLRASNAGSTTEIVITLCTIGDVRCEDERTNASGDLTLGTFGSTCDNASAKCTAKSLWPQFGAGSVLTESTEANRAVFVAPGAGNTCSNGAKSCLTITTGASSRYAGTIASLPSPYSFSSVGARAGSSNYPALIGVPATASPLMGWDTAANTVRIVNTSACTAGSVADNAFHALQGVFNGASSFLVADATTTLCGSLGTAATDTSIGLMFSATGSATWYFDEVAIIGSAMSAPQAASVCHNQYAYWTTSVIC